MRKTAVIRLVLLVLLVPLLYVVAFVEWSRSSGVREVYAVEADKFLIVHSQGFYDRARFSLVDWHWKTNRIGQPRHLIAASFDTDGRTIVATDRNFGAAIVLGLFKIRIASSGMSSLGERGRFQFGSESFWL